MKYLTVSSLILLGILAFLQVKLGVFYRYSPVSAAIEAKMGYSRQVAFGKSDPDFQLKRAVGKGMGLDYRWIGECDPFSSKANAATGYNDVMYYLAPAGVSYWESLVKDSLARMEEQSENYGFSQEP